ncbi:hypothetical protein HN924_00485 [Candidatus Woesearchaeota archaeon]|jgi:hypothetical protein|nr:hypothetical protein [Candidatus Woesearchaeota archaeon]MBT7062429.1 hypothetical protein [Candidatus Woesearchaeota archaeon]MBT7402937.1 hypothetical protein [Candidatus Woesearchaeota archaeon]
MVSKTAKVSALSYFIGGYITTKEFRRVASGESSGPFIGNNVSLEFKLMLGTALGGFGVGTAAAMNCNELSEDKTGSSGNTYRAPKNIMLIPYAIGLGIGLVF